MRSPPVCLAMVSWAVRQGEESRKFLKVKVVRKVRGCARVLGGGGWGGMGWRSGDGAERRGGGREGEGGEGECVGVEWGDGGAVQSCYESRQHLSLKYYPSGG